MPTRWTLLLLVALGWHYALAQPPPFDPQGFLPLAVGNSWTYTHRYLNLVPDVFPVPADSLRYVDGLRDDATIAITHTEEIEGHTYYVFSDVGYEWPPVPFFFLAGKKVRWDDQGRLMVRWQDTEVALYDFSRQGPYPGIAYTTEYDIPEQEEGVSKVKGDFTFYSYSPNACFYRFSLHRVPEDFIGRAVEFTYSFGLDYLDVSWGGTGDSPVYIITLWVKSAIIGERRLEYTEVVRPTPVQHSTWGAIKQHASIRSRMK